MSSPRGTRRRVCELIEGGQTETARMVIRTLLGTREFEAAFARGDMRGWPIAVLPNLLNEAPEIVERLKVPLARRRLKPEMFSSRVIVDGVEAGKLHRKHSEVTITQYRMLQRALDAGELVFEDTVGGWRKLSTLVAHAPHTDGGWWRYPIKLDSRGAPRLASVYSIDGAQRLRRNDTSAATVLRAWDRARWEGEG